MQIGGIVPVDLDSQHGASNNSSIALVETPSRSPEQDELDALIEEARRRARRRRLTYASLLAAAALTAAGLYLLVGGSSDGGSPGSTGGEPGAGVAPAPFPTRVDPAYRCPTSKAGLERVTPGNGIAGCNIHFWATLPAGWHEHPSRATVFPPQLFVSMPLGPPSVRFANVPLQSSLPEQASMPHPLPPGGIAMVLSADSSPLKSGSVHTHPKELRPSDFDVVGNSGKHAAAILDTGGYRFQVLVHAGSASIRSDAVVEATAVLNSIVTTEHLCPCGAGSHRG
jgi:hypothetical protein